MDGDATPESHTRPCVSEDRYLLWSKGNEDLFADMVLPPFLDCPKLSQRRPDSSPAMRIRPFDQFPMNNVGGADEVSGKLVHRTTVDLLGGSETSEPVTE